MLSEVRRQCQQIQVQEFKSNLVQGHALAMGRPKRHYPLAFPNSRLQEHQKEQVVCSTLSSFTNQGLGLTYNG